MNTLTYVSRRKSLKLHHRSPCTHFSRPGSSHGVCVRWDTQDQRGQLWMFHELNGCFWCRYMQMQTIVKVASIASCITIQKCEGWVYHIIKPSDVRWKILSNLGCVKVLTQEFLINATLRVHQIMWLWLSTLGHSQLATTVTVCHIIVSLHRVYNWLCYCWPPANTPQV